MSSCFLSWSRGLIGFYRPGILAVVIAVIKLIFKSWFATLAVLLLFQSCVAAVGFFSLRYVQSVLTGVSAMQRELVVENAELC